MFLAPGRYRTAHLRCYFHPCLKALQRDRTGAFVSSVQSLGYQEEAPQEKQSAMQIWVLKPSFCVGAGRQAQVLQRYKSSLSALWVGGRVHLSL